MHFVQRYSNFSNPPKSSFSLSLQNSPLLRRWPPRWMRISSQPSIFSCLRKERRRRELNPENKVDEAPIRTSNRPILLLQQQTNGQVHCRARVSSSELWNVKEQSPHAWWFFHNVMFNQHTEFTLFHFYQNV